jgi:iron complex transport system substrate-binding protein
MLRHNASLWIWPALFVLFGLSALWTQDTTLPPIALPRPDERAVVIGDGFPRTVIDPYGQKIVLEEPPARIVSAMLGADEILLDLIAPERLRAVTAMAAAPELSNCVAQAKDLPQMINLFAEPVVAMQPDLLITSRLSDPKTVLQLRQCGIRVFSIGHFDSLADIRENVVLLGRVVGAEQRADVIAGWMDQTLEGVKKRTADVSNKPRVLFHDAGFTAGKGTLFDELVQVAGGRNAAAEAGVIGPAVISTEMAIALDPDVIVIPHPLSEDTQKQIGAQSTLLDNPVFRSVRAVKTGRVYVLPSQHLNSLSHHVVKAAVDLGHALHPERVPAVLPGVEYPGWSGE